MTSPRDPVHRACDHHRLAALFRDLSADMERYSTGGEEGGKDGPRRISLLLTPQLSATVLYRLSHRLHVGGWATAAQLVAWLNLALHKVALSPASCIAGGLYIPRPAGVTFHGRAGPRLTLYSQSVCASLAPALCGSVQDGPDLGPRVSIGAQGAVLGRIVVGPDTRVAFRVTLDRDAPANSVVASRSMRTRLRPREMQAPGNR